MTVTLNVGGAVALMRTLVPALVSEEARRATRAEFDIPTQRLEDTASIHGNLREMPSTREATARATERTARATEKLSGTLIGVVQRLATLEGAARRPERVGRPE